MNTPTPPRDENLWEIVGGVLSLLWWTAIVIEALGVTLIVGLTQIEPREAALIMMPMALIAWVWTSSQKSLRRTALYSWQ